MNQGGDGESSFPDARSIVRQRPEYSRACLEDAMELYEKFTACQDSYVAGPVQAALNWLDHAFRLYGPESVICSFNGGKDAVVILHLLRAAHANYYNYTSAAAEGGTVAARRKIVRPRVIYFEHNDEFPEIIDFLHESVERYDLDMLAFDKGIKFQKGLGVLVENNDVGGGAASASYPYPLAFVLGTRQGDPNAGNQAHFAPSSHYMPPFMRVNPVLEWTYGHVWHFLRLFQLPYCSLYDRGYTSLGTTKNTLPCPALAVAGMSSKDNLPKFWPAYMLRDWDQERAGRIDTKDDSLATKRKSKKKKRSLIKRSSSVSASSEGGDSVSGRLSGLSEMRVNATRAMAGIGDDAVSYEGEPLTQRTVGLLVVGSEILKGYTVDSNTHAAAKELREQNVHLSRVVVVQDDIEDIVNEIGRLRKEVDVVITSGGVGPTHDDITIKGIAAALDCEMTLHEEMAELLKRKMNNTGELTDAQLKMATLPKHSKLRYLSDDPDAWPILQCQNLFILPGVPEVFGFKIGLVAKYLSCQLERSVAYKVVLSVDEHSIVPILNKVVANHPNVCFGSYPFVSHPDFKTVITVEGQLTVASSLPPPEIDSEDDNFTSAENTVAASATPTTGRTIRRNSRIWDKSLIDNRKEFMDKEIQLALDELITALPDGSVLRVDDDDDMLFL